MLPDFKLLLIDSLPMPAQAGLSDADAKTLAAWILAGGK